MVAFSFEVGFYDFNQFVINGGSGIGDLQTQTVGFPNGTTFEFSATPVQTVMTVLDDDEDAGINEFSDGAIDGDADGGAPANQYNNQHIESAVTAYGETYPANSLAELEFGFTASGSDGNTYTVYVVRLGNDGVDNQSGDNVGLMFIGDYPPPGTTLTITETLDLTQIEIADVPCFTTGSYVATPDGPRAVETLKVGDLVLTKDHGARSISWVGNRKISAKELSLTPALRPIIIEQGALGPNVPNQDMSVSPEHRMLVANDQVSMLFGVTDALVAARSMVNGDTIRVVQPEDGVEYIHLMFDRHEIIFVDGTETESFYPGEYTVNNLEDGPRKELLGLFPELGLKGHKFGKLARRSLKKAEAELVL